jgi:hypothetical protein
MNSSLFLQLTHQFNEMGERKMAKKHFGSAENSVTGFFSTIKDLAVSTCQI